LIKTIKKIEFNDDFIRHGIWMFFAASVGSLLNLVYQLYMVRHLAPVDYGVLNSLVGLLLIISVPAGTLQTAITKFVSTFYAHRQWKKIKIFLLKLAKVVFFFGLAFFFIIVLGSGYIASFLQIPSFLPVIIIGLLLFLSVILPLSLGGLQGLQMFRWFGLSMITSGGLKVAMGILLVSLGFRVMGALSAYIAASVTMFFLSFGPLKSFISGKCKLSDVSFGTAPSGTYSEEINFGEIYKYFLPVAVTFLCFMALVNGDVILVKHFFSPLEAGYFSIAQMAGKIILFLPGAITVVMFPKASHLHAQGKNTRPILKKSLVIAGVLCGGAALICIIFPSLVIKILSGKEYMESISLVRLFAISMTFFALLYTLLFYQLSIHRLNFIYPLISLTLLQLILIILFHRSLAQVLYILCGNSILLFMVTLWKAIRPKNKFFEGKVGKS